jgi:hypothetical protein
METQQVQSEGRNGGDQKDEFAEMLEVVVVSVMMKCGGDAGGGEGGGGTSDREWSRGEEEGRPRNSEFVW